MDGAIDQLIDCFHADCRFPNRIEARFCAQCGRVLAPPQMIEAQPAPTSQSNMLRFVVMPGGRVSRLDHFGTALSWCLALAGVAVLVVSFARIAGRVVGF